MEIPKQLTGADQFDLAQVKKMTSLNLFEECQIPIFQWRVMNVAYNSKSCESQLFPLNDNRNNGQLSLNYSLASQWYLTMTLDDFDSKKEESLEMNWNSYFVIKYKYNAKESSKNGENFCDEIFVFSSGKNKATIYWYYKCEDVSSILIEVYQVPAAIPNFFRTPNSNNNMIVGECKMDNGTNKRIVEETRCFYFGSTGQQMSVSFVTTHLSNKEYNFGVTATLYIDNYERETLVPFVVTFTIFSERKEESSDIVNKIVIRREEREFGNVKMFLVFYEELDKILVDGTLYYKVVLEPLETTN